MTATQHGDWAAHLRAALDAAAFDDAEIARRIEARLVERPDWLDAVLAGTTPERPPMDQYLMISAVTNITVPVLTGEVSPSQSARIALRAQERSASSDRIEAAQTRGVELLQVARLLGAWNADVINTRHAWREDLRKMLSHHLWAAKAGEESAWQVRGRMEKRRGLDKTEPIGDLVAFVEDTGISVEFTTLLPNGIYGLTTHDGTLGRWEGTILINANDHWVRQRYTLAHEFCHVLYQDQGTSFVNDDQTWRSAANEERRAEAFARYFLAPATALAGRWNAALKQRQDVASAVCDLMMHFGLSRDATVIALNGLPRHDEAEVVRTSNVSVQSMMLQAGLRSVWDEASQDQHLPGASPWLSETALNLFAEGKVSAKTVARVLGRSLDEVRQELVDNGWVEALEN